MASSLPDVLYALSDPLRLRIVRQLAEEGDASCGTFEVRMPKSSLSHHFKVLRDAGVIGTYSEGVKRINTLRRDELEYASSAQALEVRRLERQREHAAHQRHARRFVGNPVRGQRAHPAAALQGLQPLRYATRLSSPKSAA